MEKYKLAKINDRNSDLKKKWYVYYSYLHPETCKFKQFQVYISFRLSTKKARYQKADELITAINSKLIRGWNPFSTENKSLLSIEDALLKFVEIKETELRKRTSYTYRSITQILIAWCSTNSIAKRPVETFSYQNATDFLDHLKTKKKVNNKTYNNYRTALTTCFNWLCNREYIVVNVWKRTTKLKEEQPELIAFSVDELARIQNTLPGYNYRLWMVAQLVFYCFLRPQEIVRLRFMDFNLNSGRITVNGLQSKNRSSQVIDIPKAFLNQISRKDWTGNSFDYIFSRKLLPGKKEILPIRIAELWSTYSKLHDLNKPIYGLKHTGVGMAYDNNINPRDLQIHIRHASLDETMKYLNRFRIVSSEKLKNDFPSFG